MCLLLLVRCFVAVQLIGLTLTGGDAGSTVDAMSDAIEGADVMVYAVSLAYKESANVRRGCCHSLQLLFAVC